MCVPHFGLDRITTEEWKIIYEGQINELDEKRQKEIHAILSDDVIQGEKLEHSEQLINAGIRLAYNLQLSNEVGLQIYTGVQNLFHQTQKHVDSGIYRDAGYIYCPNQPLTVNFGFKTGNNW